MVGVTATAVLTSCEQEFYQDEQYRKEIYIVSGEGMKLYYRTIIKRDMGIITKTMSWSYQILIIK